MDLKTIFDESGDIPGSYSYVDDDTGLKKYKGGRKIKFMRGYSDEGELIFDPFDPKRKEEANGTNINYNKRFSKEMKQHHKLIRQQAMYVDQLEKLFRATTGLGTANPRQLTKTDVELASVLSQARGQLLQMINGVGSLKKTIADLYLKQLGRSGSSVDVPVLDSADMRGSHTLQQILASGANNVPAYSDMNIDDLPSVDSIEDESLLGNQIRYENQNIKLAILHDLSTSKNTPVAINEAGQLLEDYDIPSYMNDVDVYHTEGIAKDKMGHTFPLIVQ